MNNLWCIPYAAMGMACFIHWVLTGGIDGVQKQDRSWFYATMIVITTLFWWFYIGMNCYWMYLERRAAKKYKHKEKDKCAEDPTTKTYTD